MSTKKTREALDLIQARHPQAYEAALDETEAIERAVRVVTMQGVFERPDEDADCLAGVHFAEGVMESIAKDAP
jgi:glutamate mutase epsilon subunit